MLTTAHTNAATGEGLDTRRPAPAAGAAGPACPRRLRLGPDRHRAGCRPDPRAAPERTSGNTTDNQVTNWCPLGRLARHGDCDDADHRRPRRRRAARHRSARARDRHAARPAGADGVGVPRTVDAARPPRWARRHDDRGDAARGARSGVPGEARAAPLPRLDGQAHPRAVRAPRRRVRRRRGQASGRASTTRRCCSTASAALPGYGEEKAKIFLAILGKRLRGRTEGLGGVRGAVRRRRTRARWPTSTRPRTSQRVRAWKQAQKAKGKSKAQ